MKSTIAEIRIRRKLEDEDTETSQDVDPRDDLEMENGRERERPCPNVDGNRTEQKDQGKKARKTRTDAASASEQRGRETSCEDLTHPWGPLRCGTFPLARFRGPSPQGSRRRRRTEARGQGAHACTRTCTHTGARAHSTHGRLLPRPRGRASFSLKSRRSPRKPGLSKAPGPRPSRSQPMGAAERLERADAAPMGARGRGRRRRHYC
nr:octapeptide-repeat protein T2-like [Equus asinus]